MQFLKLIFKMVLISLPALSWADDCFVIGYHQPGTDIYNGPTFCNNIKLKSVTVYGPLKIKNSVVSRKLIVSGPINASNTKIRSIQVNKQFTSQTIKLSNKTTVADNVVFLGKKGFVFLSGGSSVGGKVINGVVR